MRPLTDEQNVVLIGMPGVGKSTCGVLLAKALSRGFLDTDVYIQAKEGRRLQEMIDGRGRDAFCRVEERHVLSLVRRGCVIATGGSVVYYPAAMEHLSSTGVIVHLSLPLPELERRLSNLDSRGVVMAPGQSLRELFDERKPLYARYAELTVDCTDLTHEEVVRQIIERLRASEGEPSAH